MACSSSKKMAINESAEPYYDDNLAYEEEFLDTLMVTASRIDSTQLYTIPRDNPSFNRVFDLLHTSLDLSFDWANQHVLGKAKIQLTPLFYPQNVLQLHAKGFDIHSLKNAKTNQDLTYAYDGQVIIIQLEKLYFKGENVEIFIDYTAKPEEFPAGGSDAITSDKGLFFINPNLAEANKPQQIWTQGETEHSSRWFPTIDSPNERQTHDIKLTVQDKFTTLSNGKLVSSTKNGDGTRTDLWVMDKAHAPYLTMIAVGEYAVVKDNWKGMEVSYYVEPKYKDSATDIFANTKEMLDFFTTTFDYPYPWNKFNQIIVRDYVSGAMENTTAVVYGEPVQKTKKELVDNHNDYIIAHEMVHQWFGDLVTCESWANLTLNEGFANYGEYLWFEHKYGSDEAEYHRHEEMDGYLYELMDKPRRPLIHYSYEDKEKMFDAHSYNKGGMVLHLLRKTVGDKAFFASLNTYLEDNAFSAVEADHLRLAFEKVTGMDLRWFFDQWFLSPGHPELNIEDNYDSESKVLTISILQEQDPTSNPPIFQFSALFDIYGPDGQKVSIQRWVNSRDVRFETTLDFEPTLVLFDPDKSLIATVEQDKSEEEYEVQYLKSTNYIQRFEALTALQHLNPSSQFLKTALNDNHYTIRSLALEILSQQDDNAIGKIKDIVRSDKHSKVRGKAISLLNAANCSDCEALALQALEQDSSYEVNATALILLNELNPVKGLEKARLFQNETNDKMCVAISSIFAQNGDATYIPYIEENLETISIYETLDLYDNYYTLIKDQPETIVSTAADKLQKIGLSTSLDIYKRYSATLTLANLISHYQGSSDRSSLSNNLRLMLMNIVNNEKNDWLRDKYGLN